MWARYIHFESAFISQYFSDIINVEGKESDAYVLLKDILVTSNRINYQILRPELLHICEKGGTNKISQKHTIKMGQEWAKKANFGVNHDQMR